MGDTGRGCHDPYEVLGVSTEASQRDIVQAYHRAAQRAHPDVQPDDPAAAARFQALTDAYDLLSDAGRRADYDRRKTDYDREHQAAGRGTPPRRRPGTDTVRHRSPYPPGAPWHLPIWAGPVLIEPPDAGPATGDHQHSPPAEVWSDPPVALGMRADDFWSWLW